MKLPKIPIDYSKAGSGKEPFAFTPKILHVQGVFADYQAIGIWRKGAFQAHGFDLVNNRQLKQTAFEATHSAT